MTFGGPILKRKFPTRTKRFELQESVIKDIIIAHLNAMTILEDTDEVLDFKFDYSGVYHKGRVPIEMKIRKNSLK